MQLISICSSLEYFSAEPFPKNLLENEFTVTKITRESSNCDWWLTLLNCIVTCRMRMNKGRKGETIVLNINTSNDGRYKMNTKKLI